MYVVYFIENYWRQVDSLDLIIIIIFPSFWVNIILFSTIHTYFFLLYSLFPLFYLLIYSINNLAIYLCIIYELMILFLFHYENCEMKHLVLGGRGKEEEFFPPIPFIPLLLLITNLTFPSFCNGGELSFFYRCYWYRGCSLWVHAQRRFHPRVPFLAIFCML